MTHKESHENHPVRWSGIVWRLGLAGALLLLGLSWPNLLANRNAWVEQYYSESIYQTIRRAISAVTSLVPFSVAEWLFYALTVGIPLLLLIRTGQMIFRRISWRRLLQTVASILLAGAIVISHN